MRSARCSEVRLQVERAAWTVEMALLWVLKGGRDFTGQRMGSQAEGTAGKRHGHVTAQGRGSGGLRPQEAGVRSLR